MIAKVQIFVVVIFIQVLVIAALTNEQDATSLQSLTKVLQYQPPSWVGSDPCGNNWEGIACLNNRVVSITLSSMGLSGTLSGDIGNFTELQTLDLSYNKRLTGNVPSSIGNLQKLANLILVGCSFSGQIPDSIGSLQALVFLSLNSNNFIGEIPATIGQLSKLYWLDLADNRLSGSIPISNGSTPGLDMLVNTKHFHFGRNQLSGGIPPELFTPKMTLIHLLLESNQLVGSIPSTLGLVQSLEVVRLDNNSLSGPVPGNLNNLSSVSELYLSNNKLTGPLPNLTGINALNYVDVSNNSFNPSDVPSWFTSSRSLTTLIMERTQIQGQLPAALFGLPVLQTVILGNNSINGTLNFSAGYSNQLQLIDLQGNHIQDFIERPDYNFQLILVGNPYCQEGFNVKYCTIPLPPNYTYSTPGDNCSPPPSCSSGQVSSPTCKCGYPYTGNLFFRAPSFSNLCNTSIYVLLQLSIVQSFRTHKLPVASVSLSNPTKNLNSYLVLNLQIFPFGQDHFNITGTSALGLVLSNQTFKPPPMFGPYFFIADDYQHFGDASPSPGIFTSSHKSSSAAIIVGASVAGSVLLIVLFLAGVYAFWRNKKPETSTKENDPFASWDPDNNGGGIPQLKGIKYFSAKELKKYTDNYSEINEVGSGGYGKVYRGTLPNGQLVAIKRAQQGSMQGAPEFRTEIELLSRVHHINLVKLVGFCFERGEQMLVYEYIPNGTLQDSLSERSGIRLDWMRRLQIALGAARGLQYLHELADPPIIHRDIKSNNILLDERLNAKVADFGISKPFELGTRHVTTEVKGTPGYLDPEYHMTEKLTEKSDVYSFGVLLLELMTGRHPINIVKEVRRTIDKSKDLYNLHGILDNTLDLSMLPRSLEKYVDLAMRCVEDAGVDRPPMSVVVKEIENIIELAGLKPDAESARNRASNEGEGEKRSHTYRNENLFASNGAYTSPESELV